MELKITDRMSVREEAANLRCSFVRWSWPAAFLSVREEMASRTSSVVIRSGSCWESFLVDGVSPSDSPENRNLMLPDVVYYV